MSDVLDKNEREEAFDESLFLGDDLDKEGDSFGRDESVPNMEYADLDHFEDPPISENVLTYKCPNCGAGLVYDAKKQTFVCNFCISSFPQCL